MPDSREEYDKEELGVDPEEAKVYDDARKDISYEKYPFWDAYHAVKEGAWTEDDFVQWARSVWADGADNQASHSYGEDAEGIKSNNVDVNTFIDALKAREIKKGNKDFANAAVIGVLSALVKDVLNGESSKDIQHSINRMYEVYSEE
jgi:hypothetical protein